MQRQHYASRRNRLGYVRRDSREAEIVEMVKMAGAERETRAADEVNSGNVQAGQLNARKVENALGSEYGTPESGG